MFNPFKNRKPPERSAQLENAITVLIEIKNGADKRFTYIDKVEATVLLEALNVK